MNERKTDPGDPLAELQARVEQLGATLGLQRQVKALENQLKGRSGGSPAAMRLKQPGGHLPYEERVSRGAPNAGSGDLMAQFIRTGNYEPM